MNQDAISAVLAKKGYLTYFATRRYRFAFALRQPKIIIILNFQPPKIPTQKKFRFKKNSNFHFMSFFRIVTEKEWILQIYQFSIQKWSSNVSFIHMCILILLIFCLHRRFILDNLLRGEA